MEILVIISVLSGVLGGLLGADLHREYEARKTRRMMEKILREAAEYLDGL